MKEHRLFISHISTEKAVALKLKEWIEKSFLGHCIVFVSSSPEDLRPGDNWLDVIKSALSDSNSLIVICSKASLKKPWINFEAGCAWSISIPIIPCCHAGLTVGELPIPLALFHAVDLTIADSIRSLFEAITKKCNLHSSPPIDYEALATHFSTIQPLEDAKVQDKDNDRIEVGALTGNAILSTPEMINLLRSFAQHKYIHELDLHKEVRTHHLTDILREESLIERGDGLNDTYFCLSKLGRAYVCNHNIA